MIKASLSMRHLWSASPCLLPPPAPWIQHANQPPLLLTSCSAFFLFPSLVQGAGGEGWDQCLLHKGGRGIWQVFCCPWPSLDARQILDLQGHGEELQRDFPPLLRELELELTWQNGEATGLLEGCPSCAMQAACGTHCHNIQETRGDRVVLFKCLKGCNAEGGRLVLWCKEKEFRLQEGKLSITREMIRAVVEPCKGSQHTPCLFHTSCKWPCLLGPGAAMCFQSHSCHSFLAHSHQSGSPS